MINNDNLREFYFTKFTGQKRLIGKESEYPLVYLDTTRFGTAVLPDDTDRLFQKLIESGDSPVVDDITRHVIAVKHKINGNEVDIGTDFGACTLEIGFAPMETLAKLKQHYDAVMLHVSLAAESVGIGILGYGVQPLTPPGKKLLARKGRGRTLESRFDTTRYLNGENTDVHFHTINASEQVHVDLKREEALKVMFAFNHVAPLLIALHANSSVSEGKIGEYADVRELFWDFVVAIPQDQTRKGIAPDFKDEEHYLRTILGYEPILTLRVDETGHKRFLEFNEHKTFAEFLLAGTSRVIKPGTRKKHEIVSGYETVKLTPLDLYVLDGTVWWNARLKSMEGTIEVRMMAQQPPDAQLLPTALVYGLVNNLDTLYDFAVSQPDPRAERIYACIHGLRDQKLQTFPERIRRDAATLVKIAQDGLRTAKEDPSILNPYMERIEIAEAPADKATEIFTKEGTRGLVKKLLINA